MGDSRHNPSAGGSESELARQIGGQRTAVRNVLENLELMAQIDQQTVGNRYKVTLRSMSSEKQLEEI
jgi:DNA-binding FadR family transcriptional regulator